MNKQQQFFVTGIGTDVGKTVVSAILVEALKADYWKPIQAGLEPTTDSEKIKNWAPNHGQVHPEAYLLETPVSPHWAAEIQGIEIDLYNIELPVSDKPMIVEGAGGILVPINQQNTMVDVMQKIALPVVLVSRHYLGSINHTLLTIEFLKAKNIPIHLLVFIGHNPSSEEIILKLSGIKSYIKIEEVDSINVDFILTQAKRILPFFK